MSRPNGNIALISFYGVENMGIRFINSILRKNGFNTHLIFFKKWLNNDIQYPSEKEISLLGSLLKELDVSMIGMGFTSPFLKIAQNLTEKIKKTLDAKIVWGGIHATVCLEECLAYCDIVCRGEGEETMLELANALKEGRSLDGIKSICYKKDNSIVIADMRPLIRDLDKLSFPDYSNQGKYFIEGRLEYKDPLTNARELRVSASRGCPFNCSYCYNSIMRKIYKNEHYHRLRSPQSIVSEISHSLSTLKKIKKIKFDDDTFIFPKEWIDKFCVLYARDVGLPFEILFNVQCLDEENLKKLKDSGLKKVQVGIQTVSCLESGRDYNRKLSLEKIRNFALISKEFNLHVVYDIILDNPQSQFEDKVALVEFLLTLPRPFDLFLYSLTVFPGTELCERLLREDIIKPEDVEGHATKSFHQFRLSLSYPRSKEELFIACVISLTSKSFLPRRLISTVLKNRFLRKHPLLIKWFAIATNQVKLFCILIRMIIDGDMSLWKFQEYGAPKRFLIQ
ncbi:MAG: B12-binding domain-containing radical SAM protein [Candidatus Omnitrophica bacterium]|nr:B12-binding domain-containing radical SAM protein [Candidatus Omnitrophota bacterium]